MSNAPAKWCRLLLVFGWLVAAAQEQPADLLRGLATATEAWRTANAATRQELLQRYDRAIADLQRLGAADQAAAATRQRAELLRALASDYLPPTLAPAPVARPQSYVGRFPLASGRVLTVEARGDRLVAGDDVAQPLRELVPLGDHRFADPARAVVYTFLPGPDGQAAEVLVHAARDQGVRLDEQHARVVRVTAWVDGRSRLLLRGATASWLHLEGCAPGRANTDLPTVINGQEWWPVWPDVDGPDNAIGPVASSQFVGVKPALPLAPATVRLGLLSGRGTVRLLQAPEAASAWQTVVDFADSPPGAGNYVIELYVTDAAPAAAPATPAAPLDAGLLAWYQANGDARDASPRQRHGAAAEVIVAGDRFGHPDGAASLKGNQFLSLPAPDAADAVAASFWFCPRAPLGQLPDSCLLYQESPTRGAVLRLALAGNSLQAQTGTAVAPLFAATPVFPRTWYHVVLTSTGQRLQLFVNTELQDWQEGALVFDPRQPLWVGRAPQDEADRGFYGAVDDLRFYGRALTPADVKELYHEGQFDPPSAVLLAARAGDAAELRRVLAQGVRADVFDNSGRSALHYAAELGDADAVRLLLEHGATVHTVATNGQTVLHAAVAAGFPAVVNLLLDQGAMPDVADRQQRTPLHLAAALDPPELTGALLAHQARTDVRDRNFDTPLHRAAWYGRSAAARLLLDRGAWFNAPNRYGQTPMAVAIAHRHRDFVRDLQRYLQERAPTAQAARLTAPAVVDGVLKAGEYGDAKSYSGFVILRGTVVSRVDTVFYAAYDDRNLYLVIVAPEPDARKVPTPKRGHDGEIWTDDHVELFLDTKHDQTTYFQFAFDYAGDQFEAQRTLEGPPFGDPNFNTDWPLAVTITDDAIIAELAIPFAALGAPAPKPGDIWGMNLCRDRNVPGAGHVNTQWAATYENYHQPAYFGKLKF